MRVLDLGRLIGPNSSKAAPIPPRTADAATPTAHFLQQQAIPVSDQVIAQAMSEAPVSPKTTRTLNQQPREGGFTYSIEMLIF